MHSHGGSTANPRACCGNHDPQRVPNAIDTLRQLAADAGDPGQRPREDGLAAVADVKALLQAAERVGDSLSDPDRWDLPQELAALAAAVRKVKGEGA